MRRLLPHFLFDKVFDITPEFLKKNGISLVLADLDDTLGATDERRINPDVARWIDGLRSHGIGFIVLSNNNKRRVEEFCKPADIKYIAKAAKPLTHGVRRALSMARKSPGETVLMGDQFFTDMLCAALAGLRSIAVKPCGSKAGWWVRFKRVIEKPLWKHARRRSSL